MNNIFQKLKNYYHLFQSILANLYYGFPSQKLKVIGVTGTDGKTTTTHLIYHILKSAGKKASMISSVYAYIAGHTFDTGFHVTTPDVFPLQGFLSQSVKAQDEYFVLETTSHALFQNRVSGIDFTAGVLTNITHEHLDFHKTYEEYVKAKAILLHKAKIAVINVDDRSYPLLARTLSTNPEGSQAQKIYTYGLKNKADFNIDLAKKLRLNLAKFNDYNYLAAYSLCKILGIPEKSIISALKTFKLPPGRLEVVVSKPITVIIDFAHTPNALQAVLEEVKQNYLTASSRLIHVFGSAGQRDRSKRPLMGAASGSYSDLVILTEEDYRTEDPKEICKQLAQGLKKKGFQEIDSNESIHWTKKNYAIILDRKQAIEKAVEAARRGDVVILTGKSHEKSLCRGTKEYPWDEKKAVLDALRIKSQIPISNDQSSSKSQ